jgi:tRNA(Ile)-lysidine synthase
VAAHLDASGLLEGGELALLAVSGGPDSLALLDVMAAIGPARGLSLLVVHADHGIHPDSGAVAEAVRSTARARYGLETVVGELRLGAAASETRARMARYRFFRAVQQERGARFLLTAHHADDQVETVLLRLLRGSAGAGLAGIPARGPRGLVRPLLPFRRAELAAHLASAGLKPLFDDPANADPRHTRSWVRTALLPLLESRLGPAAARALLEVAGHAAREVSAWDAALELLPGLEARLTEGRVDVARAVLCGYDNALAERVLRAAARRSGVPLGPARAHRVVRFAGGAASGRRLELGEDVVAEVAFDRLVVSQLPPTPESRSLSGAAGEMPFGAVRLRWSVEPAPDAVLRGGWTTWLVPGALAVRPMRRGERMMPLGASGHRQVRRLLMEAKVPRLDRAAWPVVEWEGEAVWVPGVCRGATRVPGPGTQAVRVDAEAR